MIRNEFEITLKELFAIIYIEELCLGLPWVQRKFTTTSR